MTFIKPARLTDFLVLNRGRLALYVGEQIVALSMSNSDLQVHYSPALPAALSLPDYTSSSNCVRGLRT